MKKDFFSHPTAIVDPGARVGKNSKIWHFCHVMKDAEIGQSCILGQNVFVASHVKIGDRVKIQNNVSLYEGVVLEEGVFCGPSCVFTNVNTPRSLVNRHSEYKVTRVGFGATIGANATIICGTTIGRYAFIGAGAVVSQDVPSHALVYGVPARVQGWMCECGEKLSFSKNSASCNRCGLRFIKSKNVLRKK